MKKITLFLALMLVLSPVLVQAQTILNNADRQFIKKTRLIRSLEKQMDVKQEEMRIAVSALRTTFKADIDAIQLQIDQAESDLESLD